MAIEAEFDNDVRGVQFEIDDSDNDITITRVYIVDEHGVAVIGKPIGSYVTIEAPALKLRDPILEERVSRCLSLEIKKILPQKKHISVLLAGLGNRFITSDSLGPRVTDKAMVTRHLLENIPDQVDERINQLSAISPGVLGLTGIETMEIIQGVVKCIKPDVIIVVDSLASLNKDRLTTTFQINNTGIQPGSGVGNHRKSLDESTMGVPVIAIGVPLVVYASTIIREYMGENMGSTLSADFEDLLVTPKDIDTRVDDSARIIANGISLGVHHGITLEEISRFLH